MYIKFNSMILICKMLENMTITIIDKIIIKCNNEFRQMTKRVK